MIELSDLLFRWRADDPPILDIAGLTVERGERLFVKGPSGSGKTTLLNLLGGVVTPQRGSVSLLDTEMSTMSGARRDAFRADHVGFIFQMFNLVPYLNLVDNVALPCRFSPARRRRAIERSGSVEDEAIRLMRQMTLDTAALGARAVAQLSMGQQQRAAAARSLIGAPELIIADEPTSSLDAENRGAFLDLLFAEVTAAEATLVFVSHDAGLEAAFDRVVALNDINRADARAEAG